MMFTRVTIFSNITFSYTMLSYALQLTFLQDLALHIFLTRVIIFAFSSARFKLKIEKKV